MGENIEIERRWLVDITHLSTIRESTTSAIEIQQWYPPLNEILLLPERKAIALSGRVLIEGFSDDEWRAICELISGGRGVRVRSKGGFGFLTIKGEWVGAVRSEYEWPVDVALISQMGDVYQWPMVAKRRLLLPLDGGLEFEIDIFSGKLEGLIIAEIELPAENIEFSLPGWLGSEITGKTEWDNATLAKHPSA